MKKITALLFAFLGFQGIYAQTITANLSQLDFGDVYETSPDSLQVQLSNPYPTPVDVTDVHFFNIYGTPAFSVANTAFTIPASGQHNIWIRFAPKHNIYHNSEVVFFTTNERGHLAVDLVGQGKYSKPYYNGTENKEEQALKDTLKTILAQGYNNLGYNGARDQMYMVLDNKFVNGQGAAQNELEGAYTGFVVSGYADRQDAQNQGVNTEHTFPQGFFGSVDPEKSDIHHLFITEQNANSIRGNLPFGVVTGVPDWQQGGSQRGGGVFEPRDAQKGQAARAMMYFVSRYQDYTSFFAPQETLLRQWHNDFPPTAIDTNRNNGVYNVQNNRNPFIDYPQLIDRITVLASNSVAPDNYSLATYGAAIDFGYVAPPATVTYYYIMVNDGNQPINITNLMLGDPTLSFSNGTGVDQTIAPGEAATIEVTATVNNNNTVSTDLTFNTNIPGQASFTVPVFLNVVIGVDEMMSNNAVTLYPNPTSDVLYIQGPLSERALVVVYDELGKRVLEQQVQFTAAQATIDVSALPVGNYLLEVAGKGAKTWIKR